MWKSKEEFRKAWEQEEKQRQQRMKEFWGRMWAKPEFQKAAKDYANK